ncbi:transcription regulator [Lactobacillus selangorensis]|uniref:Transcription regulator n=1 Tax=Lactobacillus selangorensis TaxID=81857 RepID=A0A0R2G207_9LACO|nr:GntR family transcriptional regulator [Lactobacillus selangorensis]KRN28160.1 transcription regulator [Lactobacillus selangorensis]KRN30964.1 transcription regulator [Lactobacillus selangorensis]
MYHEIAEELVREIQAGRFENKLPSEAQLVKRYKVSRNTIRKAIDLVTQKGLVRRAQGSGYFINDINVAEKTVVNLSLGYTIKRKKLTSKILTFDEVRADKSLTDRFNIAEGTELIRVVRLRYLKKELYNLETAYYVKSLIPYLSIEAIHNSIFEVIKEAYGISATSSDQYLAQEHLSVEEADLLGETTQDKELILYQTNYYGNQPFNLARTIYVYPNLNLYFHVTNQTEK